MPRYEFTITERMVKRLAGLTSTFQIKNPELAAVGLDRRQFDLLLDCLGELQPGDVGKRVYLVNDKFFQVENDAQLRQRLQGSRQ